MRMCSEGFRFDNESGGRKLRLEGLQAMKLDRLEEA